MAKLLKKNAKPPPLAFEEESMKIDSTGGWSEGSFVVGTKGITDKKKEQKELGEDDRTKPTKFLLESLEQLEMIGFGSSGRVYHVLHKETKENFALKAIPMDCSKQARLQLLDEIRALSRLQHKNIVSCPDAFLVDGVLYILLEYFDCGSLADLVKVSGPIPEKVLASFSKQILEAINFCHKQHYIHRDLKPSNFLVNSKGTVKVADFGTSSRLQGNTSIASTWVGTVTYMSPERIKGGEYTYESDIWSFGLTIFEIAVSHYPYPIAEGVGQFGFWELLDLIVQKPAPLLPKDKYSPQFCDFVGKCLEKETEKRPSAETLLKHPFLSTSTTTNEEVASWMAPFIDRIKENIKKAAIEAEKDVAINEK
ncbi:MAG: putative Mitogen-activated protein kinase kinase 1 [Streblomastix strix]|uniref:mitogen-activated protein kinase kinase n=1 Tax=Streblomastix strix TaxID=222440 RepID=A0A5J4WSR4_9EUKA|nr:MAG: putative Mitogen-activated protein kinase kinase 1 [Streblomastix strix]